MLRQFLTASAAVVASMAAGAFFAWEDGAPIYEGEPLKVGSCYAFKDIRDLGPDVYIFKINKAAKNEKNIYVYQAWDRQVGWFTKRLDHLTPNLFVKTSCPADKRTVRRKA